MTVFTSLSVPLCEGQGEPGVKRFKMIHLKGEQFDDGVGTYQLFSFPAGTFIDNIRTRVLEDWVGAASTACTLNFGDTATNSFGATTLIVPGTSVATSAGVFVKTTIGYTTGKLYSEADTLDLTLAGATPTTIGELDLIIEYVYPLEVTT